MNRLMGLIAGALLLAGIALNAGAENAPAPAAAPAGNTATAIFAAGCFWCSESDFDKVPGVLETTSGYAGGKTEHPTYEEVGGGQTGHAEALKVTYDPSKVSYEKLLDYYWHHVDLVDGGGQFCDRGSQYRPAIFTNSDEQKA